MNDIIIFLKEHPYFSSFSEIEQKELADVLTPHIFRKDELIFKKNDTGNQLFIVKDGMVRIFIVNGSEEETIAIMKNGDVFGELSLYDTQPRSASASAIIPTTLLAMTREKSDELQNKNPHLTSKLFQIMLKIISKRLRTTTMKLFGQF